AAVPQVQMDQQFLGAGAPVCRGHMIDAPIEVQIIFGAHPLIEAVKLQQRPPAGANLVSLAAGVKTQNTCLTARWLQQPQQQMDGSRFACPICPQKAKDDTCWYL